MDSLAVEENLFGKSNGKWHAVDQVKDFKHGFAYQLETSR